MKIVEPDFKRGERCGIPEIVYGEFKRVEDLIEICNHFIEVSGRVIVTKLDKHKMKDISTKLPKDIEVEYNTHGMVFVGKKKDFKITKADFFFNKTRYFTDSAIIGSQSFVAEKYQLFKDYFKYKHEKIPEAIAGLSQVYSIRKFE